MCVQETRWKREKIRCIGGGVTIVKPRRFTHKCPGGTPRTSLLLQTQRLNKNKELSKRKFKSKNAVKLFQIDKKKEQKFTESFFKK